LKVAFAKGFNKNYRAALVAKAGNVIEKTLTAAAWGPDDGQERT
jgi:hypothetical protein